MSTRALTTPAALGVLTLTALAAALRFPTLDVQSFYIDEGYTAALMFQPTLWDMVSVVAETESTPPLYYVLAWLWAKVFGPGEVGLRSLSALIGTATVPVAYLAGRELVGRRTGVIAAALVAVSPLLVWYSQEARAYALLVFLATLSALLLAHAVRSRSRRDIGLWALCGALMLATHYFAVFLVAAEGAWLLRAAGGGARRRVGVALGGVAAAGLALLPLAAAQGAAGRTSWIAAIPMQRRIEDAVKEFVTGPTGAPGGWLGALAFLLVLWAAWLLFRRADADCRRRALLAGGLAAAAIGAPFALALLGVDYFYGRNLIAAWPLVAVALAAGFAARRTGIVAAAALCAVLAAVTLSVPSRPDTHRTDWRGAAELVGVPDATRAVVVTPVWDYVPFKFYRRETEFMPEAGRRTDELVLVTSVGTLAGVPRLPAPPGFRFADMRVAQKMAVVRYVSPVPRTVTPAAVRAWAQDGGLIYPAVMEQHGRERTARPAPGA